MLKPTVIISCIAMVCLGQTYAAFTLPDSVLDISEIEEAQKTSEETGKPIAVIYVSCDTSCGLVKWATEVIIDQLDSKTILVHLPYRSERPDYLKGAYQQGRFVPKVAVLDSSLKHIMGETHYEEIRKDQDRAFGTLFKKIRKFRTKQE